MNSPQRFKLIDGTFAPAEAMELLLNLVNSKIDYHRLRLASDEVRFGQDLAHSEKRIGELRQLEASLKSFLSSASAEGQQLSIAGWVEIGPASQQP